jgi:cleavage stimulation factor subunit 1
VVATKEFHFGTSFITTHKGPCRVAAFSLDGKWAATGSQDTSVKLLDVAKMNVKSESLEDRPVIRTLYDHTSVSKI